MKNLIVLVILTFLASLLSAQTCDCTDYIYVNAPTPDEIHKFRVDANTGALTEIGSPWVPSGVINNPHGLATDINGFLYIAEGITDPLFKFNCLGEIQSASPTFSNPLGGVSYGSTNYASKDGVLYVFSRSDRDVIAIDLCDGTILGKMNIPGNIPDGWNFHSDGTFWYIAHGSRMYKGSLDLSLYTDPPMVDADRPFDLNEPSTRPRGLTTDADGNIYVVQNQNTTGSNNGIRIVKYSPTGTVIADITTDDNDGFNTMNGQEGWWGAMGMVYSHSSNLIYVGNFENCITVFNTDLVQQISLNVSNPDGAGAKAVAINTECCPAQSNLVISRNLCDPPTEDIFLQDLIGCEEGIICEGNWTVVSTGPNQTFNSCDLSLTITGDGCGVYQMIGSDDGNPYRQCTPFTIEVTYCIGEPVGAVNGFLGTCTNQIPNNDAQVEVTMVTGDEANYSVGASYTGPAYGDASGIPILSGAATIANLMHNTQYTVRVFGGNNDCFEDYTVMTPNNICLCSIADAGKTLEACNDNSSSSDPSDDYISFSLAPTGSDLGTTYSVSVNNGGTVTQMEGGAANNIAYANNPTSFRLQNGSADGSTNYTITITDNSDNSCQTTTSVIQDNCGACPTITNPTSSQTLCEGQTITTLLTNTDASSPDQIEFVYFTSQQTGNAMYTSGTSLGLVSPTAGSASISNVSFPMAGIYYVYAILNPTPTVTDCRPFQEIEVTVHSNPDNSLTVSDPVVCEGEDVLIVLANSEIGVSYQLRLDTDDSPAGLPVTGSGGDATITISGLTPNNYVYNILATNTSSSCANELIDLVNVTVNNCDFPDFPPPVCTQPACHIIPITPLVYFGNGVTADPPGNGDTNADTDVDDGIGFPNNIRRNIDIRFPITFYNNTGNLVYIQGWIDWDGDTNFDADEQVANLTIPFDGGNLTQTISHPVTVPIDAIQDAAVAMRWRISSDPTIIGVPCGVAFCAADGEVEDYLISVECPEEVCLPVGLSIQRN